MSRRKLNYHRHRCTRCGRHYDCLGKTRMYCTENNINDNCPNKEIEERMINLPRSLKPMPVWPLYQATRK